MGKKTLIYLSLAAVAFWAHGGRANAAVSQADMNVAAKGLGFVGGLSGTQEVQVLYDPANATSRADAEAAAAALAATKGKLTLKPTLTSIGGMGSSKLAYVSEGMSAHYDAIRAMAAQRGVLTFTNDRSCVAARACAMYVSGSSGVVIEVSQSAFEATPFQLAAALKMMIREVP